MVASAVVSASCVPGGNGWKCWDFWREAAGFAGRKVQGGTAFFSDERKQEASLRLGAVVRYARLNATVSTE
jgi:hypothetical protein